MIVFEPEVNVAGKVIVADVTVPDAPDMTNFRPARLMFEAETDDIVIVQLLAVVEASVNPALFAVPGC